MGEGISGSYNSLGIQCQQEVWEDPEAAHCSDMAAYSGLGAGTAASAFLWPLGQHRPASWGHSPECYHIQGWFKDPVPGSCTRAPHRVGMVQLVLHENLHLRDFPLNELG